MKILYCVVFCVWSENLWSVTLPTQITQGAPKDAVKFRKFEKPKILYILENH